MSRVNSWFGSGANTKSVGRSARPITVRMSSGNSCTVTPPVSRVASSSAGIAPIHACSSSENSAVTSSGRSRRLSTHSRASGTSSVSASNSCNNNTSTPRERIRSTNASNS